MDGAAEEDYVIEAAGPFDRLPFQAAEDMTHFLWVYAELFTRLGVWFPFTDFQRDIMTQCRVEASQLHLNGGLCPSVLSKGGSFLMPSRSPSRNLNGIILRFCRFLVDDPFGLMMRVHNGRLEAGPEKQSFVADISGPMLSESCLI
ncbi:hypothetical protein PIB30_102952 [Stylosanthes scabra]|uniref:Uncharacterized protein n=1 Tax=Stylosanthes scabra TaxID=79078 RepID=A0ABU6R0I1_9FABA|nr:hypothetical protein [Stylosanthes scabra]